LEMKNISQFAFKSHNVHQSSRERQLHNNIYLFN
jgi:hypothetical protein